MCPYYLDGDRTLSFADRFGDTRRRRAYRHDDDCRRRGWRHDDVWLLCSFQGPQGDAPRDSRAGLSKLNSMLPGQAPRYAELDRAG